MPNVFLPLFACGVLSSSESPAPDPALAALSIPSRADDADRASKNGHLTHNVDGVTIDVRYGRPSTKGRTVFGELVPWGEVWRTGANEATTIAFSDPVRINRAPLEAGVYSLFTIPYDREWLVIFNRQAEQWGASSYDEDQDALRVAVSPSRAEFTETFTVEGTEQGLRLRWADVAVPFRVTRAGPRDGDGRRRVE